jgi:hypothetical protein
VQGKFLAPDVIHVFSFSCARFAHFSYFVKEQSYYDYNNKIFYGGSELGAVTISDFSNYPDEVVTLDIGFALEDTLTDLIACDDLLFVTTKDDPNPGKLLVYKAAMRMDDGTVMAPELLHTIDVGFGPDNVIASPDCSIVATANEGEGDYDDELGLINPVGSVSIIRAPFDDPDAPPSNTEISLDLWTDEELIAKGVHLPLSLNAMIYWNSTLDVNFDTAIETYSSAMNLEPEYLAWGQNGGKLFVNLQENNAVVVVDVETNAVDDIFA